MKKVIVTGAGGYIGSRFCHYLADQEVEVLAVTKSECNSLENLQGVTVCKEPISSLLLSGKKAALDNVDVLYHLAWHGVQADQKNCEEIQIKNIKVCLSAMQLAEKIGCRKVIMPGSASEYAYCGETITGYNIAAPSDFYAATKVAAHIMCQQYAQQHKIAFNWLVIGSIYGSTRKGGNLISYTIESLLSGNIPIFTKLEQNWDYLHIEDLIRALYAVGMLGVAGKVYPVGSGEAHPLSWYVEIIHKMIDPSLALGIGKIPYKDGKCPDNSVLDISELKKDTGFSPQIRFADGIAKTIDDYRKLNFKRGV